MPADFLVSEWAAGSAQIGPGSHSILKVRWDTAQTSEGWSGGVIRLRLARPVGGQTELTIPVLRAAPLSSPLETLLRRCPWPRLPKDDGHRLYQHPRTGPVSIPSSVARARFTSPSGGFSFPSTPGSANRLRRPSLLDEGFRLIPRESPKASLRSDRRTERSSQPRRPGRAPGSLLPVGRPFPESTQKGA